MRNRLGDAAPDEELAVLHGDPEADHHEHGCVDRLAPEGPQQRHLAEPAQDGAGGDRHHERREEIRAGQREAGERHICPQRVELAVGEVDDVHEAEDEGEPDAQQGVRPAEHQAVHQVLKELLHPAARYFFARKSGSATLPSRICTMKMLGWLWPLSFPAGPSFSNLIGPFTPIKLTFQRASRTALGSSLPATRIASAMVAMPSWPRKPAVSPSNGCPRLVHSSTNALASLPSGMASGNHGMKNTMW